MGKPLMGGGSMGGGMMGGGLMGGSIMMGAPGQVFSVVQALELVLFVLTDVSMPAALKQGGRTYLWALDRCVVLRVCVVCWCCTCWC